MSFVAFPFDESTSVDGTVFDPPPEEEGVVPEGDPDGEAAAVYKEPNN